MPRRTVPSVGFHPWTYRSPMPYRQTKYSVSYGKILGSGLVPVGWLAMSDSPLDEYRDQILQLAEVGWGNSRIANHLADEFGLSTSKDSVRRAKRRWATDKGSSPKSDTKRSLKLSGNSVDITSRKMKSPDDILKSSSLDPAEWTIKVFKEWDAQVGEGEVIQMQSLAAERTASSFVRAAMPAREPLKQYAKPKQKKIKGPTLIPIMPDMHCPLEEPVLCDGFAAFLADHRDQISKVVNLGDGDDASAFGRHPKNPKYDQPAQAGIDGLYYRLRQQREAVPDVPIIIFPGNHDVWLQRRILESIPGLYGLRQAASDEELLGLRNLLRLDELQIEYLDPQGGEYFESTYEVAPGLILMHGNATGEYGGAAKEVKTWESSVGQGHDHKLAMVAVTRRLPNGTEVQRYAISFGTASRRDLGYDPKRNVNQGFGVIVLHEDGRWHPEFATFDPQRQDVCFRSWRYSG